MKKIIIMKGKKQLLDWSCKWPVWKWKLSDSDLQFQDKICRALLFLDELQTRLDEISLWLHECASPPKPWNDTHSRANSTPLASSWAWLRSDPISFRSACSPTAWTQRGSSIHFLAVLLCNVMQQSCCRGFFSSYWPSDWLITLSTPDEQVIRFTRSFIQLLLN